MRCSSVDEWVYDIHTARQSPPISKLLRVSRSANNAQLTKHPNPLFLLRLKTCRFTSFGANPRTVCPGPRVRRWLLRHTKSLIPRLRKWFSDILHFFTLNEITLRLPSTCQSKSVIVFIPSVSTVSSCSSPPHTAPAP